VKGLLIASIVALVVVGGLGLYSLRVIGEAAQRGKELEKAFEERSKELQETDALFPYVPVSHLDPVRFPTWLEVRTAVARELASRAAEPSSSDFHARETVNDLLVLLRKELVERKMSLAEYRKTSERWRALLPLPEFEDLQRSWRTETATGKEPQGLRLPPPAGDAQEKELEQIRRYARQLKDSMDADLMDPLLGRIGEGRGEG